MKATIEHFIEMTGSFDKIGKQNFKDAVMELNVLLVLIHTAKIEANLRGIDKGCFSHLKIGFGSSHMWVYQIINGEVSKTRLLIVEF